MPDASVMSSQHLMAAGMGRVIWIRCVVCMDLEKKLGHLPFTKSAKKTVTANPVGIACWTQRNHNKQSRKANALTSQERDLEPTTFATSVGKAERHKGKCIAQRYIASRDFALIDSTHLFLAARAPPKEKTM